MSDPAPTVAGMDDLTERELQVLAMERRTFRHQGVKDQAIKDELGLSRVRYDQLLLGAGGLLDKPAALMHDPVLVKRLRRLRETRQRARSARRLSA